MKTATSLATLAALAALAALAPLEAGLPPGPGPRPVVVVRSDRGFGGSGCVVDALVYTAWHVVDDAREFRWEAGSSSGSLTLLGYDRDRDLAWLVPDSLTSSSLPQPARPARVLPVAGELLWLVSMGIEDGALRRLPHYAFYLDGDTLYTDGISWGGMSGACLMNQRGEVVGVNLGCNGGGHPVRRSASRNALLRGRP